MWEHVWKRHACKQNNVLNHKPGGFPWGFRIIFEGVSGGFRGFPLFPPYSRGEVLLQKIYHFGFMSRLGKRLELTIINILIETTSFRVHGRPLPAVGADRYSNSNTCTQAEAHG